MASTSKLTIVLEVALDGDVISRRENDNWDSAEEEFFSEKRNFLKKVAEQEQLAEDQEREDRWNEGGMTLEEAEQQEAEVNDLKIDQFKEEEHLED